MANLLVGDLKIGKMYKYRDTHWTAVLRVRSQLTTHEHKYYCDVISFKSKFTGEGVPDYDFPWSDYIGHWELLVSSSDITIYDELCNILHIAR